MANTSSARKQYRKSVKQKLVNRHNLSRIRTFIKEMYSLVDNKKIEEANKFFPFLQSQIMKGVKKGVIKLNSASRKISRISNSIKLISCQA
jgi:small subunit ribosomal protein S20